MNGDQNRFKGLVPATQKLDSANRHSYGVSNCEKSEHRPVEDPEYRIVGLKSNVVGYPVGIFMVP